MHCSVNNCYMIKILEFVRNKLYKFGFKDRAYYGEFIYTCKKKKKNYYLSREWGGLILFTYRG